MKKLLLILMLGSLSVFAATVSSEKLALVNAYIATQFGDNSDMKAEITSAVVDDETKLLTSLAVKFSFEDSIAVNLGLDLNPKMNEFNLSGSGEGTVKEFGITQKEIEETIQDGEELVNKINKQGFYKAELLVQEDGDEKVISFTVVPASDQAESIKKFEASMTVPADLENGTISIVFDGTFFATGSLITKGQEGLSGFFNSLTNSEPPKTEDFNKVLSVVMEVFKNLNFEEEE